MRASRIPIVTLNRPYITNFTTSVASRKIKKASSLGHRATKTFEGVRRTRMRHPLRFNCITATQRQVLYEPSRRKENAAGEYLRSCGTQGTRACRMYFPTPPIFFLPPYVNPSTSHFLSFSPSVGESRELNAECLSSWDEMMGR